MKQKKILLLASIPLLLSIALFFSGTVLWWQYGLFTALLLGIFMYSGENTRFMLTVFFVVLSLFILFPNTGDDWLREPLGRRISSLYDLFREVYQKWSTNNSRISGNILAYSAASRKILRELMRCSITLGIIVMVKKISGFKSPWALFIAAAAIIAVPRDLFRQVYPWAAGFFNYVPPVLLFLSCIYMVRNVFSGKAPDTAPAGCAAVFIMSFLSQLFIETYTISFIFGSISLLMLELITRKKVSPVVLSMLMGSVLGGLLLFMSPAYSQQSLTTGAYHVSMSFKGLLLTGKSQLSEVLHYFILDCPVIFVSLTVVPVWRFFCKKSKQSIDFIIFLGLAVPFAYFTAGYVLERYFSSLAVNTLIVAVWVISLLLSVLLWNRCKNRLLSLFLILCSLVAVAPLPFISPIGFRCMYLSYVLMILAVAVMLSDKERISFPSISKALSVFCLGAVFLFYLSIYVPIGKTELERTRLLTGAVDAEDTSVEIPPYPNASYLWDTVSPKLQQTYYVNEPGDLEITISER